MRRLTSLAADASCGAAQKLYPSMLECEQPFSNPANYFDGSRMVFLLGQAHVVTRTALASFDTADQVEPGAETERNIVAAGRAVDHHLLLSHRP
jgi:hypothetical protein